MTHVTIIHIVHNGNIRRVSYRMHTSSIVFAKLKLPVEPHPRALSNVKAGTTRQLSPHGLRAAVTGVSEGAPKTSIHTTRERSMKYTAQRDKTGTTHLSEERHTLDVPLATGA